MVSKSPYWHCPKHTRVWCKNKKLQYDHRNDDVPITKVLDLTDMIFFESHCGLTLHHSHPSTSWCASFFRMLQFLQVARFSFTQSTLINLLHHDNNKTQQLVCCFWLRNNQSNRTRQTAAAEFHFTVSCTREPSWRLFSRSSTPHVPQEFRNFFQHFFTSSKRIILVSVPGNLVLGT